MELFTDLHADAFVLPIGGVKLKPKLAGFYTLLLSPLDLQVVRCLLMMNNQIKG